MGDIVDKSDQFTKQRVHQHQWVVTIEVKINWAFIKAVVIALVTRKVLCINHTYTNNPLQRRDT